MKLNAIKFGYAAAIMFAVIWIVCSVLVWSMPAMMTGMGGHMVHMDIAQMGWVLTPSGVLLGLVGWSVTAGVSAWLFAAIYNRLL